MRAISAARSSRTTWVSVASPSTRRSAELSSVESRELAPSIDADRLIEPQRIVDPVAREGIDHEPLLVGGDHFLRRRVEIEDALVEIDHAVDQRQLEVQARLGDDAHRLAEPDHQRLLRLVDGEQRASSRRSAAMTARTASDAAGDTELHRVPPVVGRRGRSISLSGRIGTTPLSLPLPLDRNRG